MSTLWRGLATFALLTGLLVLAPVQPATAAGTVGTGTADSCTETALETALSNGGSVTFDCGSSAVTISVTSQKTIAADTQVDGGGLVTISGSSATGIFYLDAGVRLNIADLNLAQGSADNGAALYNDGGTLTMSGATLSGNYANLQGGAIYNTNGGELSITNSAFSNNSGGEYAGGAIYSVGGGEIDITNSTFSNNFGNGNGGAIYSTGDESVTVTGGTFSKNEGVGGAGSIYSDGTLAVSGTTFDTNYGDTGSAIQQDAGTLVVVNGTFTNNWPSQGGLGNGGSIYINAATVTVADSTFNSNTNYNGGALYNAGGTLTVLNSTVNGNTATVNGGALYNRGTTSFFDSSINSNGTQADDSGAGGGIYNDGGTLTVTDSTLNNNGFANHGSALYNTNSGSATLIASTLNGSVANQGGAIYNVSGTVNLMASTVDRNIAAGWAGGIYNNDTMTIESSVISRNQADQGAGINHNAGVLTITGSLLTGNAPSSLGQGGALYIKTDTVNITSSTLTGNNNPSGGGIYIAGGTLTLLGSTLSANDANSGGALYAAGGTTSITSSIVAGNTVVPGSSVMNCQIDGGTVTSGGYNLSDDDSCALSGTGDIQDSANVSLGSLSDNGGPTETMQPDTSSAAVGAVDCSVTPSEDQRGAVRDASGTTCVIGAVEVAAQAPVQLITVYNDTGPIAEGSTATINVVATGPAGISYDYGFDCDDSGDYETSDSGAGDSGSADCTFESDGTFTVPVRVCATSDSSNCDTGSTTIVVTNTAPVVSTPTVTPSNTNQTGRTTLGNPAEEFSSSDEGASVVASATFYDPGIPDYHTCTVDYGDGSGPQAGTVIVNNDGDMDTCVGPHHIYIDDNPSGTDRDPYAVTIEVIDDVGHPGDNFTIHYVNNVPPTIDAVEADTAGDIVTITVDASDVGVEDILTYSFDCDNDGSYETEGTGNQGECSADAGATINVQVMDDDLGEATSAVTLEQPASVELCVDYLTSVVRAAGEIGCGTASFLLALPDDAPTAFCISAGLGKLRWSSDSQCPPNQELHIVPDNGPIHACYTPYLGLLRVVEALSQCSAYEVANAISATP